MKTGTKTEEEDVPKIDIIKGQFADPQKEERSRRGDLEKIEQERRSKLN